MTDDADARDLDQWLLLPVSALGLSDRAAAHLKRNRVACLGDLVRRPESELAGAPDLGDAGLAEIKARLADMDLDLGMPLSGWSAGNDESDRLAALVAAGHGGDVGTDDLRSLHSARIEDLGLSNRSTNALLGANVRFVGDLVRRSGREIRRLPKLGDRSMAEVRTMMSELGLSFDTDVGEWTTERAEAEGRVEAPSWGPELRAENAASFKEELLAVIEMILPNLPTHRRVLVAYHQLDGGPAVSLGHISRHGGEYGFRRSVSTVRASRVAAFAKDRIAGKAPRASFPHWEPSVAKAERAGMLSEAGFMAAFGYEDAGFGSGEGYRALKFTAELFGLPFPFDSFSLTGGTMVVAGDGHAVRTLQGKLRHRVTGRSFERTAETAKELEAPRQAVEALVEMDRRLEFLDASRKYFWRRPRLPVVEGGYVGNPVLACLCKLFSVAPRVSTADILDAVGRCKPTAENPSEDVLGAIVERSGMFRVEGNAVSRLPGRTFRHLTRIDAALLRTADGHEEDVPAKALLDGLQEAGLTIDYARSALIYTPFLRRTDAGGPRDRWFELLPSLRGFDVERIEDARAPNEAGVS